MKRTKKMKKLLMCVAVIILMLLTNSDVLAKDIANSLTREKYSEDFEEWLKLPEEQREKVIRPRIYEIKDTSNVTKNSLYTLRMLKANASPRYSLKDIIPENLKIRNQQQTNSCWAFAALSSLETNLALSNYKKGINKEKVYDFSERHMEYATSKTFLNNIENEKGYNRKVGSGGSYNLSESYLTNGTGAILESDMPFENNENIIDINQIKNKKIASQVYDIVDFPNYKYEKGAKKVEIMNQIKEHIQNYGSVQAAIHGNSSSVQAFNCYNNDTGAKFCDNTIFHPMDHAVSIIGWDDNYSVSNFPEKTKPKENGAWIVRNSWGERIEIKLAELKQEIFNNYKQQCEARGWNSADKIPNSFIEEGGYSIDNDIAYLKYGDNGIIYISYEDVNVSKEMYGIVKATDTVNYDYIYQYDDFFPGIQLSFNGSNVMLCNIFDKKSNGPEYLTQVSCYVPETYTCKVYVNPNGTSKEKKDLKLVNLKSGETQTISAGYHTLEFSKPIEIKAKSFAVVIEINSDKYSVKIPLESKVEGVKEWDCVKVENGKCFLAGGNDLEKCQWLDMSKLTNQNPSLINGDSTIKAFTTTELLDESLKNIKITNPPDKTTYFEGENFDKTGMIVKAYYNTKINPEITLDSSSYSITNGTNLKEGQTSVTISYEDKSVNQAISVEKNSVVDLKVKTPPDKTEYIEGKNFDKTGMVVEAIYKDGTRKIITDYIIENGNNLIADQTQITICYENKKIEQPITVIANPLMEIKVSKEPNKTKYIVGQNFNKEGMIITGIYKDGSTQEIIDYKIENGSNLTKNQSFVTIKYDNKTTTQAIVVEEKKIIEISINQKPSKTQYIQNKEELDLTGGSINVRYNDSSIEEIKLINELIKVTGFDNTKIGKNTITVEYLSQITTFDIEIIKEEVPENSNFDKANGNINSAKYYTYTNKDKKEYLVMDITINEVLKNMVNDSYEYYYYLSSNKDEKNINDWVKITENQIYADRLQFKINTKDIKNYAELSDTGILYLYVKEVVRKGGNQSIATSKAISLEENAETEIYIDDVKKDNNNSENNQEDTKDPTIANGIIPQTGTKTMAIFSIVSLAIIIAVISYFKYNKFKDIK